MADTKVSALSAAAAALTTHEFPVNEAGTSKKVTLAQVQTLLAPVLPTVVSVGAEFTGTGVPTATLPGTHATDDILILVLQSSNDSAVTVSGYTQLGPQNGFGAAATALSSKMSIFWKRDGGSESAPTIPDTGDHTYGMMFAVRGCPTVGDPFEIGGMNWKFVTSTTGTSPTSVTTVANVLVVDIFAGNADNAAAEGSSLANTDLGSVTEQFDDGTTDGTGGFIYVASGTKAAAGEVKATTVTWANTSSDLCTRLHFLSATQPKNFNATRGSEVQKFIGSTADLDDTWVRPYGARKVFVQLIDGGGSGSNGRNAATAAGGGGGGGGGYDEMWFNADELAATVSVHAGKGGAAITTNADGTAGNVGVVSQFGKGVTPPYMPIHITGTAATGAISADGGNGGCGSGSGRTSTAVSTTRRTLNDGNAARASGAGGAPGGSGTTAPTGGSEGWWGGGGGESGSDTDTGLLVNTSGDSHRGGGGGAGGHSNTNVSVAGAGGGAVATAATANLKGNDSTRFPFGGSGGNGGTSGTGTGGDGGFPGGGGGGGGTASGTQNGGAGGHGAIQVTTFF